MGPWVAQNVQVAEGLLLAALAAQAAAHPAPLIGQAVTNLPGANPDAEALLARYGFHSLRHIRHMRRGRLPTPDQRSWVYGQTSFAIG